MKFTHAGVTAHIPDHRNLIQFIKAMNLHQLLSTSLINPFGKQSMFGLLFLLILRVWSPTGSEDSRTAPGLTGAIELVRQTLNDTSAYQPEGPI
jgi:hypothetical protein